MESYRTGFFDTIFTKPAYKALAKRRLYIWFVQASSFFEWQSKSSSNE